MTINWTKINDFYINPDDHYYPLAVFYNSYNNPAQYPNTPTNMTHNQWVAVDLKPLGVPGISDPDGPAKFAVLGGEFLLTGGGDIHIALRKPGDTRITPQHYDEQSLSPFSNGGERSVYWNYAPLEDGIFEMYFYAAPYGYSPVPVIQPGQNPAVGCNLKLKGWGR